MSNSNDYNSDVDSAVSDPVANSTPDTAGEILPADQSISRESLQETAEAGEGQLLEDSDSETIAEIVPEDEISGESIVTSQGEAPAVSTAASTSFDQLMQQLTELNRNLSGRLEKLERTAHSLQEDDRDRAEQRQNREALYSLLDNSKSMFQFQVLKPMLQRLGLMFDLIGDFSAHPPQEVDTMVQALGMFNQHLKETLLLYGVEMAIPNSGDAFDVRFHQITQTRPTAVQEHNDTIAGCMQAGLVYYGQQERTGTIRPNVVRPARVVTWRYDENLATRASADSNAEADLLTDSPQASEEQTPAVPSGQGETINQPESGEGA